MPLDERYDYSLPSAYLRWKASVVGLIPAVLRSQLPTRKQYVANALYGAWLGDGLPVLQRCFELGIVDRPRADVRWEPELIATLVALERWLDGALQSGASFGC